jgi:MraZ protein
VVDKYIKVEGYGVKGRKISTQLVAPIRSWKGKGRVMAFVGTYDHTLDAKGRLVLPSKFRGYFADAAYLSPGDGCVALRTPDDFNEMVERFQEEVRSKDADPKALKRLVTWSEEVRPDAQGRIMVPARLQLLAGLDREIVVCGVIDRIEIWNAASWNEMADELDQSVASAFRQGSGI